MIDYIKGSISELTPTEITIEAGDIGYVALISLQTYSQMERLKEGKLYIHHILREDDELDYGFATKEERNLFRLLISVSGVGASTARIMLSSLTCEEIKDAIARDDVRKIQSVKGIGQKSAQKVIIELKDKIGKMAAASDSGAIFSKTSESEEEAISALILLGFSKAAVSKAVAAVLKKDPAAPVESIIKQALKVL